MTDIYCVFFTGEMIIEKFKKIRIVFNDLKRKKEIALKDGKPFISTYRHYEALSFLSTIPRNKILKKPVAAVKTKQSLSPTSSIYSTPSTSKFIPTDNIDSQILSTRSNSHSDIQNDILDSQMSLTSSFNSHHDVQTNNHTSEMSSTNIHLDSQMSSTSSNSHPDIQTDNLTSQNMSSNTMEFELVDNVVVEHVDVSTNINKP